MAQRRMFSLKIIDTDEFLDMPVSSRELYFQFGLRADDDGFVSNPKRILKMIGSTDDDVKVLLNKKFLIPFESGVCVISHWKIHNYIQKDRYQKTRYIKEKKDIIIKDNGEYKLKKDKCIQNVSKMDTQVRLGKVRLGKVRVRERVKKKGLTPKEKMIKFIDNPKIAISPLIEKGIEKNLTETEVMKFHSYWTEPTKNGKKQRWELQPTFDVGRRLATWFNNINKFGTQKKGGVAVK